MEGLVIVGSLLRTGSAWLTSVLNTHCDGLFIHEASTKTEDPIKWLEDSGYSVYGIVGADGFFPQFNRTKAKRVFLHRDRLEITKSLEKFLGISEFDCRDIVDDIDSLAEEWCERHEPYVVSYQDLFTKKGITNLWEFIFDEHPCWDKLQQFMTVNIQCKKPSKELMNLLIPS